MFGLFAQPEISIKATLACPEPVTRRLKLTSSNRNSFAEFLVGARDAFGCALQPRCRYTDADGVEITVSHDDEWEDTTSTIGQSLHVTLWPDPESEDDWELISTESNTTPIQSAPAPASTTTSITFYLNGEQRTVENPQPQDRLIDYLRGQGFTSVKPGCNEGGCGCCTVSMSTSSGKLVAINSCLRLLCSVNGRHIFTSEGIGSSTQGFHAVQKALALGNGSQCGYCSPGWVMAMYTLLQQNSNPSAEEIEQHFDGNLCRCTGYRPILEAFKTMVPTAPHDCPGVKCVSSPPTAPLYIQESEDSTFAQPQTLDQLWQVVASATSKSIRLQFVNANTSTGVSKYFPSTQDVSSGHVVDLSNISELEQVKILPDKTLEVGSGVSIEALITALDTSKSTGHQALKRHLLRVANVQVRSVASWTGNLILTQTHPQFGSDVATILAAAGATVSLGTAAEKIKDDVAVEDLLKYTQEQMHNLVVLSMKLPSLKDCLFRTEKVAQRHVNSHAIVNYGSCLEVSSGKISNCRIVFGGITQGLMRATATEAAIDGTATTDLKQTFTSALAALAKDLAGVSPSTDERNTKEYRESLARSFLYRFFLFVEPSQLPPEYATAIKGFAAAEDRPVSSGSQSFRTDPAESPIGDPIIKLSALKQASGEATYTSDMWVGLHPILHGALVYTKAASKKITSIKVANALQMPGVVDVVGASDVSEGCNVLPFKETLFLGVGDISPCVGSVVALVLAQTEPQARAASCAVQIEYGADVCHDPVVSSTELAEHLTTLELTGGLSRRRAHPEMHQQLMQASIEGRLESISVASCHIDDSDLKSTGNITGSVETGSQRHFYMETQTTCAIPQEGAIEVWCSTQDPAYTSAALATVLKIPQHKVTIKVRRAGGGFGGKLNRHTPVAAAAAVAAMKHGIKVSLQNERVADLEMTGGRERVSCKSYEASFDSNGVVNSLEMELQMDCGSFVGECVGDASMAVQFSDNVYYAPKYKCTCTPITSATVHGTSQRAPGVVQSQFVHECVMERIARSVGQPHATIQERNFYQVNQVTPYGDHIGTVDFDWTIPQLWKELHDTADIEVRRASVAAFNKANKWRKRGLALQPIKYGMGLPYYKSGALVNCYADGSVSVAHGGCEIGQGIHTVACQVAAGTLGIPLASVTVHDTDTSKIPNNTGTGGSGTTECTAEAVREACAKLAATVAKYRKDSSTPWTAAVKAALAAGESLSAWGWYANGTKDNLNAYATYGVGATEAEVDILTGEVQLVRTDIIMDLGQALNPDVAIGQLEGGFVMALGFMLTEEVLWSSEGKQLNLGSWNYKIPSAYDIPIEMNVSLLKGHRNTSRNAILGSKACAEPAMPLAIAAFFAVKEAIYAARADRGHTEYFPLNAPATVQAISAACAVEDSDLEIPF